MPVGICRRLKLIMPLPTKFRAVSSPHPQKNPNNQGKEKDVVNRAWGQSPNRTLCCTPVVGVQLRGCWPPSATVQLENFLLL